MKKITPLSEFPTEALLKLYRKNRQCFTDPNKYKVHYNRKKNMWEYWKPIYGEFTLDDGTYLNPVCIGFRRVNAKDVIRESTEINGNVIAWTKSKYRYGSSYPYHTSEFEFEFEGMYWKGDISELKAELAGRPHIGNLDAKTFRKWKIEYKKERKVSEKRTIRK